jgi:ParB family chromosome partitioning protein
MRFFSTRPNETSPTSTDHQSESPISGNVTAGVAGLAAAPVVSIRVADIMLNKDGRIPSRHGIALVQESMRVLGQQTPIAIKYNAAGEPVLVSGAHRLEAAKRLKWEAISCVVLSGSERDARLWTISENLHRTELTYLERSQYVAEWVNLVMDLEAEAGHYVHPIGGHQPHELGIARAARWLAPEGTAFQAQRKSIERLFKISRITPEAKKAALESGLGDHQSALLEVARQRTEAEQVAKVRAKAQHLRESPRNGAKPAASGKPVSGATEIAEPSRCDEWKDYPELPAPLDRRGAMMKAHNDPAFDALQSAW